MITQLIGPIPIPLEGGGFAEGAHYNIARAEMTEALEAFEIDPAPESPVSVWALDEIDPDTGRWRETVFLRFEDNDQARTILGLAAAEIGDEGYVTP